MTESISPEDMMRACMRDKVLRAMSESPPSEESIEWMRALCAELKTRLHDLLPNRRDLRDALDRSFDVDLLMQMFRHEALDFAETTNAIHLVFGRLKLCCAPCQDEAVAHAEEHVLKMENTAERVAVLLEMSHRILDDIFRLTQEASARGVPQSASK